METRTLESIADALLAACDGARTLPLITAAHADFDVPAAYEVLRLIAARRIAQNWQPVGRKIGFTNRTLWPRYGVYQPMWAPVWSRTLHRAPAGHATLSLTGLVQPRIEPEVVFKLNGPVRADADARGILESVEWVAAGFEIVQSHFPEWKFSAADCTAAFGLHGALVVGAPTALDAAARDRLAEMLPEFELTLRRGDAVVDRGSGANVLGSPALALAHLANVLAIQPQFPPLAAGEIVTTGTVTDAWPVRAGESWRSDYGVLDVPGITLRFT